MTLGLCFNLSEDTFLSTFLQPYNWCLKISCLPFWDTWVKGDWQTWLGFPKGAFKYLKNTLCWKIMFLQDKGYTTHNWTEGRSLRLGFFWRWRNYFIYRALRYIIKEDNSLSFVCLHPNILTWSAMYWGKCAFWLC